MPLCAKRPSAGAADQARPIRRVQTERSGAEETKRWIAAVLLACRWPFRRGLAMKDHLLAVRRPRRALERSARARLAADEFQPALGAAAGVADLAGCEPSGRPLFSRAFGEHLVLERRQIDADDLRRRAQPPWIGDVDDGTQVGLIARELLPSGEKLGLPANDPVRVTLADAGAIRRASCRSRSTESTRTSPAGQDAAIHGRTRTRSRSRQATRRAGSCRRISRSDSSAPSS